MPERLKMRGICYFGIETEWIYESLSKVKVTLHISTSLHDLFSV